MDNQASPVVYQDEFDRIEREVDGGTTDLGGLGFWSLVRRIKQEPALAAHWAEVVGRIDRKAFLARVRPTFPIWLGNALLVGGAVVLVAAVAVAVRLARGPSPTGATVAGVLAVVAAGGLSVTVHSPSHWLVGRVAGMRFLRYFIGGPTRVTPGIKVDYATYLRADPGQRMAMHAAGAVASKIAPFAVFAGIYVPHALAGWELFPEWSLWTVLGFGVVQVVTDITWSRKVSDWSKVRRERLVARAQEAARR